MRFTVADGKILGISVDQINFAEASAIPEPAQAAGFFGVATLALVALRRRRHA